MSKFSLQRDSVIFMKGVLVAEHRSVWGIRSRTRVQGLWTF